MSNRLGEVMKTLTIVSTIFIPLSFIAGVYGMNFEHMPELGWVWGYPAALALMAVVAGGLLYSFWRRGWLRRRQRDDADGPGAAR
jgi:magnesium transporter